MEALIQQVEEREDELISLLSDLIAFRTPAPPARNTEGIQNRIAEKLRSIGFEVDQWEVYPGDPNVVGSKKGTEPSNFNSLILNGHVDVASVEEDEDWETAPFKAAVRDRMLHGRGAADMKGGVAACLFALQLLHENNVELPGDVLLQSVIGEEVGEAGTKQCCERGYSADFALVADTSDCEIHGQGGVVTGWVTVKSPTTHHDGTRHRMVHAGGGLRAASAIEKMNKLITALQELERDWAVNKSYPGFAPGTNTINPAVIEGGRHAAFVADECRLWITVHFYPDENAASVAKEIEDHLLATAKADLWMKNHPPTFEWGGASMIEERGEVFPSFSIDEEHLAVDDLKEAHEKVFSQPARISMSPSVNDGGWLAEAGISTVCYGPGKLEHAHAVNEQMDIDQLLDYTKTLLCFIVKWCNHPKTCGNMSSSKSQ
ncbi:acetylornithine deacetylase [Salicibibacter halophilus]|uniref:Acetylornithine deacetylase n=1 Tax=Salicibibacter halophilus TaxID=2502791 RepID=A0A514LK49_9BACI|nr:acetylornithine deacetylase [Salicibibacter halophilus]QDI92183.1 acetylornithine deacetylase [Salicibibacter halophilus]